MATIMDRLRDVIVLPLNITLNWIALVATMSSGSYSAAGASVRVSYPARSPPFPPALFAHQDTAHLLQKAKRLTFQRLPRTKITINNGKSRTPGVRRSARIAAKARDAGRAGGR